MQPSENAEDLLGVFGLNSDAVVLDGEIEVRPAALGFDVDERRFATAVLDRVADQILKDLNEPDLVRSNRGKLCRVMEAPFSWMEA